MSVVSDTLADTAAPGFRPGSGRLAFSAKILVFCLLWSSAFAAGKVGLAHMPPLLLLAVRFLLAGAVLLAAAGALGLPLGRWRDLPALAGLGLLNNALYLGLSYSGMTTVSSGLTAMIISANPVLTALLAAMILGERLTARKLAGLVLGVGGVAFILRHRLTAGGFAAGATAEDVTGVLLVLAALVSLVLGAVLFKRFSSQGHLVVNTGVQAFTSGLALLPLGLAVEGTDGVRVTADLVIAMAYMVFAVSIGAYLLWFHLLRIASATAASSCHFLMPPLGLLFGWLVLGEPVLWADFLGIAPVALGIALVNTKDV